MLSVSGPSMGCRCLLIVVVDLVAYLPVKGVGVEYIYMYVLLEGRDMPMGTRNLS